MVHGDFEKSFIMADIASYDDLVATPTIGTPSKPPANSAWKVKTTLMQNSDIVEFKFNAQSR